MSGLVVHGGAGSVPDALQSRRKPVLQEAAEQGMSVVKQGESAVDAVVRAVMVLEEHPLFNAGVGSALTLDGRVEMDASLMSSRGELGAVSELSRVDHPVRVARMVMEETDHCFLTGNGLEAFVEAHEVPRTDPVTDRQREKWERLKNALIEEGYDIDTIPDPAEWGHCMSIARRVRERTEGTPGTVGAVAVDRDGVTAAATSTGGTDFKLPGRVGDSPVPGAGTIATGSGAVSVTGEGEGILRLGTARTALEHIKQSDVREAADRAVQQAEREDVKCGLITMDTQGAYADAYNTEYMDAVAGS